MQGPYPDGNMRATTSSYNTTATVYRTPPGCRAIPYGIRRRAGGGRRRPYRMSTQWAIWREKRRLPRRQWQAHRLNGVQTQEPIEMKRGPWFAVGWAIGHGSQGMKLATSPSGAEGTHAQLGSRRRSVCASAVQETWRSWREQVAWRRGRQTCH